METDADNGVLQQSGDHDYPLNEKGRQMAKQLRQILEVDHSIDVANTPVAVSERRRTQETARLAGFTTLNAYSVLNPIHDLTEQEKNTFRETGMLPPRVIEESQKTLDNFPFEKVVIIHGLRDTGIFKLLNLYQESVRQPYPHPGEIREADI